MTNAPEPEPAAAAVAPEPVPVSAGAKSQGDVEVFRATVMKKEPPMKTWEERLIIVKNDELLVYEPGDVPDTTEPRGSSLTRENNNGVDLKFYKAKGVARPKMNFLKSFHRCVTLSCTLPSDASHQPVTKEFHFAMMAAEKERFITVINSIN